MNTAMRDELIRSGSVPDIVTATQESLGVRKYRAKRSTEITPPASLPRKSANKPINSACVIAELLAAQGFTDYLANRIENYWKRNAGLTERQLERFKRLDAELSRIMKGLSEGDRGIVGKFISLHKRMSFDTGLRIGIQAFAVKQDKEIARP